jgi:microcystin-dependent protein
LSWNGAGTFIRKFSWVAQAASGVNISSVNMDTDTNDIVANGFGNTLTRDGQGGATANLPMNNFRHTGVGNGIARTDYAALGQVQDGSFNWAIAAGQFDAITATLAPPVTTLVDGQLLFLRALGANSTTTPGLILNGLPSSPPTGYVITRDGGMPLVPGDIPGPLSEIVLRYNAANTRWELLNPATNQSIIPSGTETFYAGISAPSGWYFESGQAISRNGDPGLFAALTFVTSGAATPGSANITNLPFDMSNIGVLGAFVESPGLSPGLTITAISPTTLTLSASITATGTIPLRFLPYGQGDGSSSFNLPDRRGRTIFGRDNMNGSPANRLTAATTQGINGESLGGTGGEQAHSMLQGEIIGHQHSAFIHDPQHSHGIPSTLTGRNPSGGAAAGSEYWLIGTGNTTSLAPTGIAVTSISGGTGDNLTTSEGIGTGFDGVGRPFNVIPPASVSNIIIKR